MYYFLNSLILADQSWKSEVLRETSFSFHFLSTPAFIRMESADIQSHIIYH